jgi:hypothetical protein
MATQNEESRIFAKVEAIGRKIGEAETYNDATAIKRERSNARAAVAAYKNDEAFLDRARFFYCEGVRAGRIESQRQREERRRELSESLMAGYGLAGGGRNW